MDRSDDSLDNFNLNLDKDTDKFIPWAEDFIVKDIMTFMERKLLVLEYISRFGQIQGDHHKAWVIDQIARILTGHHYQQWVKERCEGEDGPDTYNWDIGICP